MSEKTVIYDDGNMRFVLDFWRDKVFVHFRIDRWTGKALRTSRSIWPEIKAMLRNLNYKTIHAYYAEATADVGRLAEKFGFSEVKRKNGWVLMEVQNA